MCSFARAVVALLVLAGTAVAQPPAVTEKMVTTDHQTVKATITYEIRTGTFAARRWMVFVAEPPELPSQGAVKVVCEPTGAVVADRSPLARKVRYFDVAVPNAMPGGRFVVRQEISATIRSRQLVPLADGETAPQVPPLTAAEQKHYTSPSPLTDFESKAFQGWLDAKGLRARKGPLPFAARVLEVIRTDYQYKTGVHQEQRASAVCARGTGDCASMTLLFVGAMRANKFPARALVGRNTRPRAPGTDEIHAHVRAEVFAAGVGWVPVDPAYANGDKSQPVAAFVGHDPGDMLVLHVDTDLRLRWGNEDTVAGWLQQNPHYKAFGKGAFDGTFGPSGWELKAEPVGKK